MMSKWSSKPADHNVVRLRNNQRRHRKRVKDRISELERLLAQTQSQLNQAQAQIAQLSGDLDQARALRNLTLGEGQEASDTTPAMRSREDALLPCSQASQLGSDLELRSSPSHQNGRLVVRRDNDKATSLFPDRVVSSENSTWSTSPILSAPATSDIRMSTLKLDYNTFADIGDRNCCDLPPPEPGTSTTRCLDAYVIITQQNYKDLDSTAIRQCAGRVPPRRTALESPTRPWPLSKVNAVMKLATILALSLAGAVKAKYWLEEIPHLGRSPYFPDSHYRVFRNVKDYGAVGDGITDDTTAINAAISAGVRCAPGVCKGSTLSPATVYFPDGTYLISDSIVDYYYTQIIGDPTSLPTIKAASNFPKDSFGLIDANPYLFNGALAWNSTNVFFRQIRNIRIDTTSLPPDFPAIGIHWPSSQATSITNCVFYLSTVPGNHHTGLFIEEGSGGLLNDLWFYGGGNATVLGNQQYTARNLRFYNADVAIWMPWDWGWTFKSMFFEDCRVGIQMDAGSQSVGSITLLDSWFQNVGTAIVTTRLSIGSLGCGGTVVLEHVQFDGVTNVLVGPNGVDLMGRTLSPGEDSPFLMGHYADSGGVFDHTGYYTISTPRSPQLLDGTTSGRYYEKSKPQYEQVPTDQFYSARANGAYGDANQDDTQALIKLFGYTAANNFIAYLDAGIYIVTDTVLIPPNARILGEAQASIIMATGPKFQDVYNPRPVIQVGRPGAIGRIEWSDTIVSTRGPAAGAVLIEYNLNTPALEIPSGMWDVHTRVGGYAGTYLQVSECAATKGQGIIKPYCIAAYMSMHITASAGGLFSENCWFWVADHDLEDQEYKRVAIYAGRGVLIESRSGRIWLSASGSEHHVLYQYQLANTRDLYLGHAQTEEAYFQPLPAAQYPFPAVPQLNDPDFANYCQARPAVGCNMGWGMRVLNSSNVVVYGAGLYSFFNNYNDSCASNESPEYCQERILNVEGQSEGTRFLGLSTVGTRVMVERNGIDAIAAGPNNSTFADTLALYVP
ncbi:Fc.00g059960.m01.CDS01 [Cosmosporella sp. VM-42]